MNDVKQHLTHRQRQALATQQLIVDSAIALFLEQGYGATTIEAISQRAGVAVSTVYALFKSKRGILKAIRESWHSDSGLHESLRMALLEPDPSCRLELAAQATRRQWETGANMILIYQSAAAVDAEAAAELHEALEGRRRNLTTFVQRSSSVLRADLTPEQAAAIFLALTHVAIYQELVNEFGWPPDAYERWLAKALQQQLLA
jgi:AcrR family transcriptional regulator